MCIFCCGTASYGIKLPRELKLCRQLCRLTALFKLKLQTHCVIWSTWKQHFNCVKHVRSTCSAYNASNCCNLYLSPVLCEPALCHLHVRHMFSIGWNGTESVTHNTAIMFLLHASVFVYMLSVAPAEQAIQPLVRLASSRSLVTSTPDIPTEAIDIGYFSAA